MGQGESTCTAPPREDLPHHVGEVLGKRRALRLREKRLVVHLQLHPLQEVVDVFWRAALDGLLHLEVAAQVDPFENKGLRNQDSTSQDQGLKPNQALSSYASQLHQVQGLKPGALADSFL
jgi:hypothetical protein